MQCSVGMLVNTEGRPIPGGGEAGESENFSPEYIFFHISPKMSPQWEVRGGGRGKEGY